MEGDDTCWKLTFSAYAEGSEVGSGPIIVPNIEVGDTFTIRSKRSVLANRGPSMSLSMESDPYRKVTFPLLSALNAISISQCHLICSLLEWQVQWFSMPFHGGIGNNCIFLCRKVFCKCSKTLKIYEILVA